MYTNSSLCCTYNQSFYFVKILFFCHTQVDLVCSCYFTAKSDGIKGEHTQYLKEALAHATMCIASVTGLPTLSSTVPEGPRRTPTPPSHPTPHPISSEHEGPNSTVETASTTVLGRENIALKAFIKCFNELHTAILPHTKWLAEKVSAQRIISKEFLILGTVSKPSQNASLLLSNIQSAISKDYRCLRRFVRVLKKQESLKSVAESLITSYRKLNLDHQAVLTSQLSLILKGYSSEECESYSFIL